MERRVFIAVLLSFVVLYTYQTYFTPPPAPPGKAPAASSASPASSSSGGSAPAAAAMPAPAASAPAVAEPEAVALLGDSQSREITVETPTARIVFSNRGAQVLHWQLKKYRDTASELVDLVPSDVPGTEPHPFSLQAENPRDPAAGPRQLRPAQRDRQ